MTDQKDMKNYQKKPGHQLQP